MNCVLHIHTVHPCGYSRSIKIIADMMYSSLQSSILFCKISIAWFPCAAGSLHFFADACFVHVDVSVNNGISVESKHW